MRDWQRQTHTEMAYQVQGYVCSEAKFTERASVNANLRSGYLRGWRDKGIYKAEVVADDGGAMENLMHPNIKACVDASPSLRLKVNAGKRNRIMHNQIPEMNRVGISREFQGEFSPPSGDLRRLKSVCRPRCVLTLHT